MYAAWPTRLRGLAGAAEIAYDRRTMIRAVTLALAMVLTGCMTAYKAATDERPVSVQASDATIVAKIRKGFLDAIPKSVGLDVFCHEGHVVLAGVPDPPPAGERAAAIARAVEGVKRVDSYFLPSQPSRLGDLAIGAKVKTKIVGDVDLRVSQVDMTVVAGHVVLTGIVDRQEKIDRIIHHARSVDGVVAVKSFMRLKSP